jgi:hypothetical protein
MACFEQYFSKLFKHDDRTDVEKSWERNVGQRREVERGVKGIKEEMGCEV